MKQITDLTATELVQQLKQQQLSAVEVLEAHIQQIEARNPELNALVTVCLDKAMDEAKRADQLIIKGKPIGRLHGLPYAVKDTLLTKGVPTTFGSLLFKDYIPDRDAIHVERACRAGAIVIGKTNTPECALGGQTTNSLFGITKNPVDLSKTVTGSSGGAAATLAACMAPMVDGSDLGGSLRAPASVCGVVGFRPTAGQVPKYADKLPYDCLHVYGPMARCVEDISLFMSVFSGYHPACPLSATANTIDFTHSLKTDLTGTRIALSATPCGTNTHPEVKKLIESHQSTFTDLACIVTEACPDIGDNHQAHQIFVAANAATEYAQYLSQEHFPSTPRLKKFIEKGINLTMEEIMQARQIQAQSWKILSQFFLHYDFLVWPTMAGLPFDIELPEEQIQEDWRPVELTPSLNIPAISIPAGLSKQGLPIGLQILGPPNSDFKLLQLAYALQQAIC